MSDFENVSPEQMKKMMEEMQKKKEEGLTPEQIEERRRQKELQKQKNIALLDETLGLCEKGSYALDGKNVRFTLSREDLSEILVYLPEEIEKLPSKAPQNMQGLSCTFKCENKDALSLARERSQGKSFSTNSSEDRILLLNLASSSRPGGAVREGANGQEEDLCRKSSLLLSLESPEAKRYYDYNKNLHTHLGSDAVMITPNVAVFRDKTGALLEQPFYISVMSCAAPMVRMGLEGKSEEEYKDLLYKRIDGMLRCACSLDYKNLILGAFGCGAFGNDAAVVSDAFLKAFSGLNENRFAHVDFAVLCEPGKEYNYREFCRNFDRAR